MVVLVNLGEPGRAALGIEGAGGPVFSVWRLSSANAYVPLLCEGRPFLKGRIIGSILLATPTRANLIESLNQKKKNSPRKTPIPILRPFNFRNTKHRLERFHHSHNRHQFYQSFSQPLHQILSLLRLLKLGSVGDEICVKICGFAWMAACCEGCEEENVPFVGAEGGGWEVVFDGVEEGGGF